MNRFDGEIGRGRRADNESSSSRESSRERSAPKRSFTPTGSDDEQAPVPSAASSVAEESSSAPQPLLRQAMAFRTDNPPKSIVTYEAQPPAPPKKFLPGQQVPITAPKKAKKDKTPSKRPRKAAAYPGQTTRFRIETYDPTPSNEPPINHGTGPYSSMYRGVAGPQARNRPPSPTPMRSGSSANNVPSSSMASSHTLVDYTTTHVEHFFAAPLMGEPQAAPAAAPPAPPSAVLQTQPQTQSMVVQGQGQGMAAASASSSIGYAAQQATYLPNPPNMSNPPHFTLQNSRLAPLTRTSSQDIGSYYRRDYERRVWAEDPTRSPPRKPSGRNSAQVQQVNNNINNNAGSSRQEPEREERRAKHPVRMVTLLIRDVRSGTTDRQLVEVKVSLRPNEKPEEGFWADAKEISDQLQNGPCRIDGPARAYTLRGKYRQFILRVSPDNEDFTFSTNVYVNPDRTLDMIVEMLHPPGSRPAPPVIPPEIYGPEYDDDDDDQQMDYDPPPPPPRRHIRERETRDYKESVHETSQRRGGERYEYKESHDKGRSREQWEPLEREEYSERRDQRKRINSPSFDDYDEPDTTAGPSHPVASKLARRDYDYENSPRQSPRHRSPRSPTLSVQEIAPPKKRKSRESTTVKQSSRVIRQKSPASVSRSGAQAPIPRPPPSPPPINVLYSISTAKPEEEKSQTHIHFMLDLKNRVKLDDKKGFADFYRAKAGNRISDIYSRYLYFKKLCTNYVGKTLDKYDLPITEKHLVQTLRMEDEPDFLDNYKETMRLIPLYYAEDPRHVIRYQDPRVSKILQDTIPRPMKHQPGKELLKFLREVDDAWEKDNHNGKSTSNLPPTSSTTTGEAMSVDE